MLRHLKPLALASLSLALLAPAPTPAAPRDGGDRLRMVPGRHLPYEYVVKKGDTLWDIAARFLKNPWQWPEIWERNSYITNPDLIYPGDLLVFDQRDGMLKLKVVRAGPQARALPLEAIPTVRAELILPFLNRPGIATDEELKHLPYVLASKDARVIFGQHDVVYARGFDADAAQRYDVVRLGPELVDPGSRRVLGHRLDHLGVAEVLDDGPVRRLRIVEAYQEIRPGDRLLPQPARTGLHFMPRAPAQAVNGVLFAAEQSVNELGQGAVGIINLGTQTGMEPGQVLTVYRSGRRIDDPVTGKPVVLPEEAIGTVMVFRPFARVSYVLVMDSIQAIRLGDSVRSPAAGERQARLER